MSQNQPQDQLSTYILAVADTLTAREELALNLAAIATAKVREASSFAAAVADLRQAERRVDLAIVDLEMSGAAAVTLTRKLRDPLEFRPRNIAILLIGGAMKTPNYLAAARLGIQGHLARPFTTDALRQAIRAALLARPMEVAKRPVAAVREAKAETPAVAAPEPAAPPYVPVANKPFQHGLQSRMRVVPSLSPDEAFGFEPAPSMAPRPRERRPTAMGEIPFAGRKLSAVG